MKILVPVKRVLDANVRPRLSADGASVDLAKAKMGINPFCEIAVEEAVRLREAGTASEVVVVSIGPAEAQDVLRAALAMGADRAILIEADADVETLAVAKLLKAVVAQEQPDLVIAGKQAIDDDSNQTGQMLAALLGWPQATFASAIAVDGKTITVTREVDGGLQTLRLDLPALVTADLRLNEPRYPSLAQCDEGPQEADHHAEAGRSRGRYHAAAQTAQAGGAGRAAGWRTAQFGGRTGRSPGQ